MREIIEKLLNEYVLAKTEIFSNNPFGNYMRKEVPLAFYNTKLFLEKDYLVVGSVGQGNWANVPWICIFDRSETTTAQKGVYIVYLLSKDGKTLYLTFNQGCTEIRRSNSKIHTIKIMRDKARDICACIDSRGFSSDENINLGDGLTELAELYQKGTILYKAYRRGQVPSEEELQNDLSNMIEIYKEYKDNPSSDSPKIGSFDSWEILSDTVAIKHCDKSFFEYNGSGIPKEICWFFNAENIIPGERRDITLSFDNKIYSGIVSNSSSNRVQIRWNNDLGQLFGKYNENSKQIVRFIKKNDCKYEVIYEGSEKEMTVKDQLAQIKEYIAMRGFSYEGNLIDNFWLSLKSKPFVLLAGTSGTGKTRLVRLFAEAVGATTENGRYKLVSVRPDWSDSSDLFGHVDLNGRFVPGAIIDFVKQAELNPSYPYFLCLDEMNLARVEYYLSDFLSVIETRDRKNGKIVTDPLVDTTYYGKDESAAGKYGKVILPDNLYVIGTVNMDETTFPFSRKVLDRANTIEFSYVNLNTLPSAGDEHVEPLKLENTFLKTEYLSLKECMSEQANFQGLCDRLEYINSVLQKAGAHVGYRVRDEIVFYLMNNKKNGLISEEEAFDNEIMQKILPRIQGSSSSVKTMLCDMFRYCAGDYTGLGGSSDSEQMQVYIDQKSKGKYPRSTEKIVFMTRRFEEDGFTSYWL